MFDALKTFFEPGGSIADEGRDDSSTSAELAAAALMLEIARADRDVDAEEVAQVRAAIERAFGVDPSRVDALVDEARERAEDSTSLYEFTRVINAQCDDTQKYQLMLNLWRVAHADGNVDHYESHLLRRIADLIHMRHGDYISAKLRAAEASG